MKLKDAKIVAGKFLKLLEPHCVRIAIAGSIRREKTNVEDIEIVCIPKLLYGSDLFGNKTIQQRSPEFIRTLKDFKRTKGDLLGKYMRLSLPEGIELDLFMAIQVNWGYIFALRTGSALYNQHVLLSQIKRCGYKAKNGLIYKGDDVVPVPEEQLFFEMLRIGCPEPRDRKV